MNTSVTAALAEAATLATNGVVILPTITITHPLASAILLVQNREGLTARDEDDNVLIFEASSFEFSLPDSSIESRKDLNLAVPNVGRQGTDFLAQIPIETEQPITVVYREYLSTLDDTQQPQSAPIYMELTDVSIDAFQINGRATVKSLINAKYPSELYTLANYPALSS